MARPVSGTGDELDGTLHGRLPWDESSEAGTVGADEREDAPRGRHAAPSSSGWWRGMPRPLRWAIEIVVILLVALLASLAIRTFLGAPATITDGSMANTLQSGERVVVSALPTRLGGAARGEVVAFRGPVGWSPLSDDAADSSSSMSPSTSWWRNGLSRLGLATPSDEDLMILRVVATGGQRIACCDADGRLELDGVPLIEPYLKPGVPTDQVFFDVVVPDGHVFVLGDDRAVARDSRYHLDLSNGVVPLSAIEGRVVFIAWPLDRLGPVSIQTGSAG